MHATKSTAAPLKAFSVSVSQRRMTVVRGAATTTSVMVPKQRNRAQRSLFVRRTGPRTVGPFDRERHEVPFILVQLVGGQVDGLRARPVA